MCVELFEIARIKAVELDVTLIGRAKGTIRFQGTAELFV